MSMNEICACQEEIRAWQGEMRAGRSAWQGEMRAMAEEVVQAAPRKSKIYPDKCIAMAARDNDGDDLEGLVSRNELSEGSRYKTNSTTAHRETFPMPEKAVKHGQESSESDEDRDDEDLKESIVTHNKKKSIADMIRILIVMLPVGLLWAIFLLIPVALLWVLFGPMSDASPSSPPSPSPPPSAPPATPLHSLLGRHL